MQKPDTGFVGARLFVSLLSEKIRLVRFRFSGFCQTGPETGLRLPGLVVFTPPQAPRVTPLCMRRMSPPGATVPLRQGIWPGPGHGLPRLTAGRMTPSYGGAAAWRSHRALVALRHLPGICAGLRGGGVLRPGLLARLHTGIPHRRVCVAPCDGILRELRDCSASRRPAGAEWPQPARRHDRLRRPPHARLPRYRPVPSCI